MDDGPRRRLGRRRGGALEKVMARSGTLMLCGTTSDAGKSTVVAGLCRLLAREGVSVAPFKGQNMSLNSVVTSGGAEIGRAQWLQAVAAGAEPEAAMNPVLLKPTGERSSQVIVMGRPLANAGGGGLPTVQASIWSGSWTVHWPICAPASTW